ARSDLLDYQPVLTAGPVVGHKRVGLGDRSEPLSARLRATFKGFAVYFIKPKLWLEPVGPLEIVEQTPGEVPTDVYSFVQTSQDAPEGVGHIPDALDVVVGRNPVLGDDYGDAGIVGRSANGVLDHLGPVLVAHLRLGDGGIVCGLAFW